MKIVNKEQFAKMPVGIVFCLFDGIEDGRLYVKSSFYMDDNKPSFNGVIPLCPSFEAEEYNEYYSGEPDETKSYYTECFSTDTALCDFDDNQLFAVFSKQEVRRMIDVLTYALSNCDGKCITDEDCYIIN